MRDSGRFVAAAEAPCTSGGGALDGPASDRVDKAFAAWDATFDKGDATALAAFYTEGAYVLPPRTRR